MGSEIVGRGKDTSYLVGLGERGGLCVRVLRRGLGEVGQKVLLGGQIRGSERGRDGRHDLPVEGGDSRVQSR